MIDLAVGGLRVRVVGEAAGGAVMEGALAQRWAGFVAEDGAPDLTLRVAAAPGFSTDYHLDDRDASLGIAGAGEGSPVRFEGAASGWFDAERGAGQLDGALHLGQVDALLRLSLSLSLPARGALLLHGTAVEHRGSEGEAVTVLVGDSGAGKSTAAAALGGDLGDELVILHATPTGIFASGTPYWRGTPRRRPVAALAHLRRGGSVGRRALSGGEALRAIAPHVVRYVARAAVDRAAFALLALACARVPVMQLDCPEGAAFVPFLRRAITPAPAIEARS